jgi:hypothetical protein
MRPLRSAEGRTVTPIAWRPLALWVALVVVAVAPPALAQSGKPEGPIVWQKRTVAWDAWSVGPRGHSIEVLHDVGFCAGTRNFDPAVRETPTDVHVAITIEVEIPPPDRIPPPCTPALPSTVSIVLHRPLAGRSIRGRSAAVLNDPQGVFSFGKQRGLVPNLVGFAPRDARHALLLGGLRERVDGVHAARGLPRVVAQSVPAGRKLMPGSSVRVRIAAR